MSAEVRRLRDENATLRQQLKMDQEGKGVSEKVQSLMSEVQDAHQQLAQVSGASPGYQRCTERCTVARSPLGFS